MRAAADFLFLDHHFDYTSVIQSSVFSFYLRFGSEIKMIHHTFPVKFPPATCSTNGTLKKIPGLGFSSEYSQCFSSETDHLWKLCISEDVRRPATERRELLCHWPSTFTCTHLDVARCWCCCYWFSRCHVFNIFPFVVAFTVCVMLVTF